MLITYFEWMTSNEYKVNPTCCCERITPRLDPLLQKVEPQRGSEVSERKNPTNKHSYFGHFADVLELSIDIWEGTTFDLVGSRHNNGLPCFRARLSSRDVVQVTISTILHEARMKVADSGLVETPYVSTKLREELARLGQSFP